MIVIRGIVKLFILVFPVLGCHKVRKDSTLGTTRIIWTSVLRQSFDLNIDINDAYPILTFHRL